ncbi:aspartate aminotransferase family protein [Anaerotignum sp. MB30-C6]|uniref:aspartate aminotransferase family protein n=1 Tax=Anaerotignum sp. MB30-C6 TaxID=3070814 RepID=UPI0027DD51DF|nr:aspartate aminotransferase family protein [Anaerotignum sp. MB30-C6]WMI81185.1 aspartate aminotransferase family protein [Anaerotignum sp. MB30-C6]
MSFETIKQKDHEYIMHTYGRYPVVLDHGKNATCYDTDGKEYIDMTSGIGVNALGFCDKGWVDAITAQLHKLQHTSNLYYTTPSIEVAKLVCEKSGMKKMFFSNSGAEANEGVIKAARKYSFTKYGTGRSTMVALENSFHGRTMATLSATGQETYHNYFFPFVDGFVFAKANNLEDTLSKLTDDVCAVFMEMVQGEGGVLPLDKKYVKAVFEACKEKDILFIVDEVQTGIGRTGSFFSYQQFDIQPDLVSCAKGLGGGLPIGGVLFGEKTEGCLGAGDHGSTFGGNPVVCAGSLEILNRLDENFLAEIKKKGDFLKKEISSMPHVTDVAGMGMMLGVSLDVDAKEVIRKCLDNGLMILSAKTKVRLLPPLTITRKELEKGLTILADVLKSM